jgi:hypothetical protein
MVFHHGQDRDAPERRSSPDKCPVCEQSMEGRDPYGHSLVHFSTEPIPNRPDTLGARRQQAELLGRQVPEE